MRVFFLSAVFLGIWAGAALAGDVVFGLGTSDFSLDEAEDEAVFVLEYHNDPFRTVGKTDLSVGFVAAAHANGDVFLGAGLSAYRPFAERWFVEGSFMPGLFLNAENETDLGSELEFRTLIGVGREFGDDTRVSLGISHKSNADTGRINPGVNTLHLRIRRSF